MRRLGTLALCVALASAPLRVVHADEDPAVAKARVHLRAGMVDYDEGRYAEAAVEMERAYAIKAVPDLQYNLGQCYGRLDRFEDAAKAYELFLAGHPDSPEADVVQKRIVNLRMRAQAIAEGKPDPMASTVPEKVVFKTLVVYREVPPPPGRAARAAAYGLGTLGAAGLATGIAFAVLTTQASHDVQSGQGPFDATLQSKQDAGRLYPIGTGVGFGVGALAIGGAVGLWLYARKVDHEAVKSREETRVPTLSPFYARSANGTTAGLSLAGQF